jgi:hypothetical protein
MTLRALRFPIIVSYFTWIDNREYERRPIAGRIAFKTAVGDGGPSEDGGRSAHAAAPSPIGDPLAAATRLNARVDELERRQLREPVRL